MSSDRSLQHLNFGFLTLMNLAEIADRVVGAVKIETGMLRVKLRT